MVHCEHTVAVESDSPSPIDHEPRLLESAQFVALQGRIARMLQSEARGIAERWEVRARSFALRENDGALTLERSDMAALVTALAAVSLASGSATTDDIVTRGLAFGESAFEAGASLHYMLKGLDLLSAMVLYAVEAELAREPAQELGLHDAVRLVRRLQQGSSLLSLAASKAYTQALGRAMRSRFRHLRHDLRNPLGTIKGALALMDDESVPLDEQSGPRLRAMARRNARSLGELIANRLSDAEAIEPVRPLQTVSLRTVACAVRRSLRREVSARATTVLVAGAKTRVRIDAAGVELLMHELLMAALNEAVEGDEISIDFDESASERGTVCFRVTPPRSLVTRVEALTRLTALADRLDARVQVSQDVLLSFPAQHVPRHAHFEIGAQLPVEAATDGGATRSARGDTGHDIRSSREHEHGQSSPL